MKRQNSCAERLAFQRLPGVSKDLQNEENIAQLSMDECTRNELIVAQCHEQVEIGSAAAEAGHNTTPQARDSDATTPTIIPPSPSSSNLSAATQTYTSSSIPLRMAPRKRVKVADSSDGNVSSVIAPKSTFRLPLDINSCE